MWKNIPNFKIKKKADIETFLNECLLKEEVYMIKCRSDYAIFIRTFKDRETQITVKYGNLRDIFNPEIQLSTQAEIIKTLWFYRKKINEQFFS